jgi:hypothetical protein
MSACATLSGHRIFLRRWRDEDRAGWRVIILHFTPCSCRKPQPPLSHGVILKRVVLDF